MNNSPALFPNVSCLLCNNCTVRWEHIGAPLHFHSNRPLNPLDRTGHPKIRSCQGTMCFLTFLFHCLARLSPGGWWIHFSAAFAAWWCSTCSWLPPNGPMPLVHQLIVLSAYWFGWVLSCLVLDNKFLGSSLTTRQPALLAPRFFSTLTTIIFCCWIKVELKFHQLLFICFWVLSEVCS